MIANVDGGVKENHLGPEEEKLLVLLTLLIEDYERKGHPMNDAAPEAA
jgi:hypothetical protein